MQISLLPLDHFNNPSRINENEHIVHRVYKLSLPQYLINSAQLSPMTKWAVVSSSSGAASRKVR